jgi:hypothetical protein
MPTNPAKFQTESIEHLILTIRGQRGMLDADLAPIFGVATRTLNQAVKRNVQRFPRDFVFQIHACEKKRVITICDHLARLKFSKSLPWAYTEHGAIMATMVLNSAEAATMSVYVVRAFVRQRDRLMTDTAILKRLAEIDRTLLIHDAALRDVYAKLKPLLLPPPEPPRREIGFHTGLRVERRRS